MWIREKWNPGYLTTAPMIGWEEKHVNYQENGGDFSISAIKGISELLACMLSNMELERTNSIRVYNKWPSKE